MRKSYPLRALIALDQFLNVALFNGNEDQTISGHVGYKSLTKHTLQWVVAEKVINIIFFFDANHCYNSIEWDEVNK